MTNILSEDYLYSELVLTPEHLAAIGSVAIESSNCERMIESIIWSFLGIKERQGKFLSKGSQFKTSLELMHVLGKEILGRNEKPNTELINRLTELKTRIDTANTKRNIIIHGEWKSSGQNFLAAVFNGPEKYPPAKAYKRTPNSAPSEFPAEHSRGLALELGALSEELARLIVDNWDEFFPSPDKSESQPQNQEHT